MAGNRSSVKTSTYAVELARLLHDGMAVIALARDRPARRKAGYVNANPLIAILERILLTIVGSLFPSCARNVASGGRTGLIIGDCYRQAQIRTPLISRAEHRIIKINFDKRPS